MTRHFSATLYTVFYYDYLPGIMNEKDNERPGGSKNYIKKNSEPITFDISYVVDFKHLNAQYLFNDFIVCRVHVLNKYFKGFRELIRFTIPKRVSDF